jgi:hypothetical protein
VIDGADDGVGVPSMSAVVDQIARARRLINWLRQIDGLSQLPDLARMQELLGAVRAGRSRLPLRHPDVARSFSHIEEQFVGGH